MWRPTNPVLRQALALTRQGKLVEATRLIQAALGADREGRGPARAQATARGETAVLEGSPAVGPTVPDAGSVRAGGRALAQAGRATRGIHRQGGHQLAYELRVPASFVEGDGALVVMLHGCKQDATDFARAAMLDAQAERFGCIVLSPEQSPRANATRCWNWFDAAHQRSDAGEPGAIAAVTREIAAVHRVRPDRVYIAGLSAGGAMAAILAAVHPEIYAAVGVHSGIAPGAAHDLRSAFAAMAGEGRAVRAEATLGRVRRMVVFHGDQDSIVKPVNLAHLAEGFLSGRDVSVIHETGERSGRRFTRSVYRHAHHGDVLETWLVHGLAHAWSGGSPSGSFADPQGPDATAEMLRFFHAG